MSARSANAKRQQRVFDGYESADTSAGLGSSMREKSAAKSKAVSPTRKSAATSKKSAVAAKKRTRAVVSVPPAPGGRKVATKKAATTRKRGSARKTLVARKKMATTMLGNLEASREPAPVTTPAPSKPISLQVEAPPPAVEKTVTEKVAKAAKPKKVADVQPEKVVAKAKKAVVAKAKKEVAAKPAAPQPVVEAPPPKPKVLRYARGEERKSARQRMGMNGAAHHSSVSSPSPLAATMPPRGEKMSVAAQQRAMAEEAFSRIAPSLSAAAVEVEAPEETPQHRGGPPAFHRSEFQIRFSQQDQLATAIRLGKNRREVKSAAVELIEQFGKFPPDQAVLMKVLELSDDDLLEKALDELLELDGRGKVRQSPELMTAIRGIRSKNAVVQELVELLVEKLG